MKCERGRELDISRIFLILKSSQRIAINNGEGGGKSENKTQAFEIGLLFSIQYYRRDCYIND